MFDKENIKLILILLIEVVIIYFTSFRINQLFHLALIIYLFVKDEKKYYFWLAYYFILINAPGKLFSGGLVTDTKRLPFVVLTQGLTVGYLELLGLFFLIKGYNNYLKYKNIYFFNNTIKLFIYYVFFVFLYSILLGMSLINFFDFIKNFIFPFCIFLFMPNLIKNKSELFHFLKLIFPFIILSLVFHVHALYTGEVILSYFKDYYLWYGSALGMGENKVSRVIESWLLSNYVIYISMMLYQTKQEEFNKNYLILVAILGIINLFLSASRGHILSNLFFIILVLIINIKDARKYLNVIFLFTILLLILMNVYFVKKQFQLSLERLSTVLLILEGDPTAGNTNIRLTTRSENVLRIFNKNPILGWGYSQIGYKYSDEHVGNQNLLLHHGIIGTIILFMIYFSIFMKVLRLKNRIKDKKSKQTIKVILGSMISIFIIHSTSTQFLGLDLVSESFNKWIFHAFYLQSINILYYYITKHNYDSDIDLLKYKSKVPFQKTFLEKSL